MRVRKQIPTITNQHAPEIANYHQGPILTNGALEYVYDKPVAWPLYTYWGNGIRTKQQFNIIQPPQLRVELALTEAPIYGAGVPSGTTRFQGLEDMRYGESND